MDFDHLPGKDKLFDCMAHAAANGMKALDVEMNKCDVVCSNCHRNRSWWRKENKEVVLLELLDLEKCWIPDENTSRS